MMDLYKVYSSNWEVKVESEDFSDAVTFGTLVSFLKSGKDFSISPLIFVEKVESKEIEIYKTSFVFFDLGYKNLANQIEQIFHEYS